MFRVIEGDVLKDHILPDIFLSMAAPLEAAGILHFVMEFFDSPPRDDIGEGELNIRQFRPELVANPRLVVAFAACYIPMRGGFPGIDINFHVVAEAAEGGSFGITPCPPNDEKQEDKEGEERNGLL